jgi:hypothetical protein
MADLTDIATFKATLAKINSGNNTTIKQAEA